MTRSYFILCFAYLCCILNPIFAQSDSLRHEAGMFAYANNEKGKFATTILKKQHYKYAITHQVLSDLIAAKGDKRMPTPTLKMSNSERYAAYAKPQEALIGLEVKAYDICTSFGKDSLNAIAILLAHELTHYYEKHNWTNHFISEHKDMDVSKTLSDLKEKMKLETQADYLGGFLAYTAGYPCLEVMPNILQGIYDGYRFPEKMKGYPDLPERKKMAEKAFVKLQNLVSVFETANWLVAIENYEDALKYYNHILLDGQYQSREVYNNMGVITTLAAMSYFKKEELKYVFPLELDPVSRIGNNQTRDLQDYTEQIEALLELAIQHFKTANTLDPDYAPALLNLASVYLIRKEYFDAEYHIRKALQLADTTTQKKVISDAATLLGIMAALQNQKEKSLTHFDMAIAMKNPLAKLNKDILIEKEIEARIVDISKPTLEKIDSISLGKLVTKNEMGLLEDDFSEKVDINDKMYFRKLNFPNSKILINDAPSNNTYTFFHITESTYKGVTERSIQIGSTSEEVTTAYGIPKNTMELTDAHYMHYNKQKLIFMIQDGQVTGWCSYRKKSL